MAGSASPVATVVVPTRNSRRTLAACLASIRAQSVACEIVVVDNHSTDGTREIAAAADRVLVSGPERSAQRNLGARAASTPRLAFIDADMMLSPQVIEQAVAALEAGAGAAIVPEDTCADGFFGRVREYERRFYEGSDAVEAARVFSAELFFAVGGFDESMTGTEDRDLTARVRGRARVVRTAARIVHDEGLVTFRRACAKKGHYASGIATYHRKHGDRGMLEILDRPYLRRPWILARDPVLGAGLVALKVGEAAVVGWHLMSPGRGGAPADAEG